MELRDVAERGKAPRGSIYHHFPGGKRQLAIEAATLEGTQIRELIERSLAERGIRQTLAGFGEIFRRRVKDHPERTRLPGGRGGARPSRGPGAGRGRDRGLSELGRADRGSAAQRRRRARRTPRPSPASSSQPSRAPCSVPAPPAARSRSTRRSAASSRRSTRYSATARLRAMRRRLASSDRGPRHLAALRVRPPGRRPRWAATASPMPSRKTSPSSGWRGRAIPFPMAVPAAGIVTRWKVQVEAERRPAPAASPVLRPTGKANELLTVDESETRLVEDGANEFATRIPVRAGDRFGLSGFTETYVLRQRSHGHVGRFTRAMRWAVRRGSSKSKQGSARR